VLGIADVDPEPTLGTTERFSAEHGYRSVVGPQNRGLQVQGADYTFANGINNSGTIVGDYTTDIGSSGFLLSGGVFTTIQFPGSAATEIYGINDSGAIVGDYSDADGNVHAFIATSVPEPSSALLAGIALPLIVVWARRRRLGQNA
jgi:uncharacterized membrane protein